MFLFNLSIKLVILGMAGYGLLHWLKWMKEDAEEEAGR
jgi:hypothetical protein